MLHSSGKDTKACTEIKCAYFQYWIFPKECSWNNQTFSRPTYVHLKS